MSISTLAGPDRRQDRWHRAHQRLYEAACESFLTSGYLGTSMDEIALRAHVSRKTAFNHYLRKRDFITEWGRRRREEALASMSAVLGDDATLDDTLREYFAALARINLAERALTIRMSLGWRESGGPFDADPHELVTVYREFIADAVARGEVPSYVDPARLAMVLYSSYFGLLYDWCEGADDSPPFDLHLAFMQLLDIVLTGLHHRSD